MKNKDDDDDHGSNKTKLSLVPNIIPNLPDELAFEILSRLPPKSILWYKSVCKTWLNLFSNPDFIKIHLDHTTNVEDENNETLIISAVSKGACLTHFASLLRINNPTTTFNLDCPSDIFFGAISVVGSVNGLICIYNAMGNKAIAIWNPVIKQYKYLPCPAYKGLTNSIGFCYDSASRDYIVVRLVPDKDQNLNYVPLVELYSLNSDSWRPLDDSAVVFPNSWTCNVIIKGEPYWLAAEFPRHHAIMRFDIFDKKFRQVPQLRIPYGYEDDVRLVNYKDSLAVLVDSTLNLSSLTSKYLGLGLLEHETSERCINLLVIDSEGSWRVELRFGFPRGIERMIGSSKSGRIVLQNLSGEMVLFNAKNEKIENINVVGATASFVPIKGSKQV